MDNMTMEGPYNDFEEWMETLVDLGVDLDEAFPSVMLGVARVEALYACQRRYSNERAEDIGSPQALLAALDQVDDLDDRAALFDAVLDQADRAAYRQDPAHRDRTLKMLGAAVNAQYGRTLRTFTNLGEGVLDAITPVFDELAATVLELAPKFPLGAEKPAEIATLRLTSDFERLQDAQRRWNNIGKLIGAWVKRGVLKGRDDKVRVSSQRYMLLDLYAYRHAAAQVGNTVVWARGVVAGQPHLNRYATLADPGAEIDTMRRSHEILREMEQAREEIVRNRPRAHVQKAPRNRVSAI